MSNSFEILMNQLGMPSEMRQAPALAQADIERVVVHKISKVWELSLIHISEPTRLDVISYAVFCLKKKKIQSSLD